MTSRKVNVTLLPEEKLLLRDSANKKKTVIVSIQATGYYEPGEFQIDSVHLLVLNKKKVKELYKFSVPQLETSLQSDKKTLTVTFKEQIICLSQRYDNQISYLKELERTIAQHRPNTTLPSSKVNPSPQKRHQKKLDISLHLSGTTLDDKLSFLRNNTIGRAEVIRTPDFWEVAVPSKSEAYRKLVAGKQETHSSKMLLYEDFTASGRGLSFIEDYMKEILKMYANTHTEVSATGATTSVYLNSAMSIIKEHVHAGPDSFVIAVGAGVTGAIQKLQQILGVYQCPRYCKEYSKETKCKVVVFVGPYEHHSNDVSWQDNTICEFRRAKITEDYDIDMKDLEAQLSEFASKKYRILGSFSACSNVTGFKTNVKAISDLLHKYDGCAFFDYASSGPYVDINMERDNMDAVFLSPHKNLGGPGACGILIGKKWLYDPLCAPSFGGGGTVDFVTPWGHKYIEDIEIRETAGTPPIRAVLQAALSFQVKDWVGHKEIESIEDRYCQDFMDFAEAHPAVMILGNTDANRRIPVFSLVIRHADKTLHQHLTGSLLNDLFGIQARTGCSCAGPYGHSLLHIDQKKSRMYTKAIEDHYVGTKPGWIRIGFHYTMTRAEFLYTLYAINALGWFGHLFLSDYLLDIHSGLWKHKMAPKSNASFGIHKALELATTGQLTSPNETLQDTSEASREKMMRSQKKEFARLVSFRISNILSTTFGKNPSKDSYRFYKIALPIIYQFLKKLENNSSQIEKKLSLEASRYFSQPTDKIEKELKCKVFNLNSHPELDSYDELDCCDESIRKISYFYVSKGNVTGTEGYSMQHEAHKTKLSK